MADDNSKQRQGNKDAQTPMGGDDQQRRRDIEEAERRAREATTLPGHDQHCPGDRDRNKQR